MHKTLHKVFTKSSLKSQATAADMASVIAALPNKPDMRAVLQGAAGDLLQPRPEAISILLKKIRLS